MMLSAITLGQITFPSFAAEGWSFRDLTDWWGQTDDKKDAVERPQAHGSFPARESLRASRAISFTANYVGSSQAEAEVGFDALSATGAEGPVLMTVTTPAGSSWRVVTVESVKPVRHRGGSGYGMLAVDLIARDPRRYSAGEWLSTPPPSPGQGEVWPEVYPVKWPGGGSTGRFELINSGRAPSAPIFRLYGPFPSAQIACVETGHRVGFARPVPAGSSVEISMATKRAVLDGQSDVSRWLRFREWTEIPGLVSRSFQFEAGDDAALMMGKVDSAWW
jgi:hypothetical protein